MKTNWLITTAAAAILASTTFAAAQGTSDKAGKAPAAAEKSAPSHSTSGQANPESRKAEGTPGHSGAAQTMDKGGSSGAQKMDRGSAQHMDKSGGQREKSAQGSSAGSKSGDRASDNADRKSSADKSPRDSNDRSRSSQKSMDRDHASDRNGAADKNGRAADSHRSSTQKSAGDNDRSNRSTTGARSSANINLTVEQRTKIRQVVVSKKIPKVDKVNFNVSVGVKVPRTVHFYPIPTEVVEIHPAWRGYSVVLVGSELVIIDPATYEIIAVVVV
jgi:hypothetical protein